MRLLKERILRFASMDSPTPVLIVGETGSGKEGVAHALHTLSPRAGSPFISENCASMESDLVQSKIFGHEKGSFTGADRLRAGVFERAGKGSVFLDEFSSLDKSVQALFLRVVEGHPFERVGGSVSITNQAKILVATNEDIVKAVAEKRLREDLYFRLAIFRIDVPPLREHMEDLPELVDFFLKGSNYPQAVSVGPGVLERLLRYSWPGNIRQLQAVLLSAYMQGRSPQEIDLASVEHVLEQYKGLGIDESGPALSPEDSLPDVALTLREVEKLHISRVLEKMNGNQSQAAISLGITRSTLRRKITEYHITFPP